MKQLQDLRTSGRTLGHCAKVYDAVEAVLSLGQARRWARRCAELLELKGHERVLDIGCGTGLLTAEVAQFLTAGGLVIGIDASPQMLQVARRKRGLPNCIYQPAVAEELPFEDASFDAICSSLFFHHVERELKLRALREAHRIARPGSLFVVLDLGPPNDLLGRLAKFAVYAAEGKRAARENLDGVLPDLIQNAGFVEVEEVFRGFGLVHAYRFRKSVDAGLRHARC